MVQVPNTEAEGTARQRRPRLLPLAAAALVVIAGISILPIPESRVEEGMSDTATLDSHVELPQPLEPVQVAESFMTAWVGSDSEGAASLFRPGTKFHGFEPETFPALHHWYEATGWEFSESECGPHPAGAACHYLYKNKLTRAFSIGPVVGLLHLYIEDGQIWLVSERFDPPPWIDARSIAEFDKAWTEFSDWIVTNHPDDFERMYEQHPNPTHFALRYVLIDQLALELWEHYTDEFVEFSEGI